MSEITTVFILMTGSGCGLTKADDHGRPDPKTELRLGL